MAGLSAPLEVRAPAPTDGERLAGLWKLLWDVHEGWGSYPGSRDERVYRELGVRLAEDARTRGASPSLGRHIHLIASVAGEAVGQVEGWVDRHGLDPRTPWTCEVRSLVVSEDARHIGAARSLLRELARVASELTHGAPTLLAAEVLEQNPAMAFYAKLGFWTPAYAVRLPARLAQDLAAGAPWTARLAVSADALPICFLEANLAERRRSGRDRRFDPPRALDASLVDAIARHLEQARARRTSEPAELVVVDRRNVPRASATLAFATLEPPFLPGVRAILSRISLDHGVPPDELLPGLVQLAGRLARLAGADHLEVVDLAAPGSALHHAALRLGAAPWSRVALREVQAAHP